MTRVTWYGHSAFRIACDGANVIVDPFLGPTAPIAADSVDNVDMVLVTHDHADHVGDAVSICRRTGAMLGAIVGTAGRLQAAGVPGEQIINGIGFNMGGTVACKGVQVTMTQAYHSSESGAPAGYIIRMPDGATIYHAGDTCIFSGMEIWGKLFSPDLALLPIGGVFTMDGKAAALAAKMLGVRGVIPMHWGTFPVLASSTAEFEAEMTKICPNCVCHRLRPGASIDVSPRQ